MPTSAEHPARADAVGQRAGDHEAEAVHEVVDAHDHGEHATAERIGSATLHEQRVAHDRSTVADPCEDEARERDPDVRRHGGCRNADRLQEDARGIDRPDRMPLHPAAGTEAADREAEPDAAEDEPVAEVARVERVLGEKHLCGLRGCHRSERDRPDDEHRQERPRVDDSREAVLQVAEVTTTDSERALEFRCREPQQEQRGDRNETPLIQYATSGPAAATSAPPMIGATVQLTFSLV